MAQVPQPKRGEVWVVRFDPSVGAEIRKLRPAIVMSVNAIGRLPLRIVVPLTDWQPTFRQFPWFTPVRATPQNGLTKDSGADAFQVKSVSNTRLIRRLGSISDQQADEIASAISLCVGTP